MRLNSLGDVASSGVATHSTLGDGRFAITQLSDDPDTQVAQTMRIMGQRVKEDAANPIFQAFAGRVFEGIEPSDKIASIERAYRHVRSGIKFQRDEVSGAGLGDVSPTDLIEFIVRPVDMAGYVEQGIAVGDCDDFSSYLACLLATRGIPAKFCTVAAEDRAPDQYSHVYCVAYCDGQRIPLDSSHGEYPGWEVDQSRRVYRKTEWATDGGCPLVTLAVVGVAAYFGWKALKAA